MTARITNGLTWPFRTIASGVHRNNGHSNPASIVNSLKRNNGRLAKAVRHLVIPSHPDHSYISTTTILNIMESTQNLASFSWNANYAIPLRVLEALHRDHPSARLKVTNHNRKDLALDEALLSSPQLHTLDITVRCIHRGTTRPQDGNGDLSNLKTLLMRGGNLKVLRLRLSKLEHFSIAKRSQYNTSTVVAVGPSHFRFQHTDTFPMLEELVISRADNLAPVYEFSPKHCSDWAYAMDWSEMRILDVASTNSEHLLREIAGLVPKLHTLRLNPSSIDRDTLESFLHTVPLLTDLKLVSGSTSKVYIGSFDKAVTRVCETIGPQLRSLQIECKFHLTMPWQSARFQEVLGLCPQLRYFESIIDGLVSTGEWEGDVVSKPASYKYALMSSTSTRESGMQSFSSLERREMIHC